MEPLVAGHDRRRVVPEARRLCIAQGALELKKVVLRQLPAGKLRRERLQIRQGPVAFFDILRVERRDHRCSSRHDEHQLLALQQLQGLAYGRAADAEIFSELGIEDFLSGLENACDDPVADRLIDRLTGGLPVNDSAALWNRHGAPSF